MKSYISLRFYLSFVQNILLTPKQLHLVFWYPCFFFSSTFLTIHSWICAVVLWCIIHLYFTSYISPWSRIIFDIKLHCIPIFWKKLSRVVVEHPLEGISQLLKMDPPSSFHAWASPSCSLIKHCPCSSISVLRNFSSYGHWMFSKCQWLPSEAVIFSSFLGSSLNTEVIWKIRPLTRCLHYSQTLQRKEKLLR